MEPSPPLPQQPPPSFPPPSLSRLPPQASPSPLSQTAKNMTFDNLRIIKVLGKGAMGTVFLVHDVSTDPLSFHPFALKVVEKSTLHTKHDADRRARWEIEVLSRLHNHPFLPHLISSCETHDFLCWAVPYCPGGDLNALRHHQNDRVFSPSVVHFYLSEIITALEHLHDMGIVYRDLKPENILVQQSGHVTLTDFDLSRTLQKPTIKTILSNSTSGGSDNNPAELRSRISARQITPPQRHGQHRRNFSRWVPLGYIGNFGDKKGGGLKKAKSARVIPVSRRRLSFSNGERSNSFVGTEEYVSPEVVRGDGHEFAVDWWALGVLTYEMLYGVTPFKGKNRKETFRNVLVNDPEFIGKRNDLTDLIERLLEKDPTKRLGYQRGASEVKEHVFFKGVKWDLLTEVSRPPYIPSRDEGDLTAITTADCGADIREYFQKLRAPPLSLPPSPLPSPSSDYHRKLSEF